MRLTSTVSVITFALASVLTSGAAPPAAEAGKACKRAGLSSPCIKSNDLKARLNFDEDGKNARLRLRDAAGDNAVQLDASSGNVTNLFSNSSNESNGLVKAWAQINANGTIAACWRCNTDPAETRQLGGGQYEVDFTPLATDITGRPRSVTLDGHTPSPAIIGLEDHFEDPSSVLVFALLPFDDPSFDFIAVDSSFTLIIY